MPSKRLENVLQTLGGQIGIADRGEREVWENHFRDFERLADGLGISTISLDRCCGLPTGFFVRITNINGYGALPDVFSQWTVPSMNMIWW